MRESWVQVPDSSRIDLDYSLYIGFIGLHIENKDQELLAQIVRIPQERCGGRWFEFNRVHTKYIFI